MTVCECCGSRGKIINSITGEWMPCPKCKGVVAEATGAKGLTLESFADSDVSKSSYQALKIPKIYENLTYSGSLLRSQAGAYFEGDVREYISVLDRVRDGIISHVLPEYSMYLHAPNEIDIALWVYTVLRLAVDNGFTAVPYLSLHELYYLTEVQDNRGLYIEYLNAQVCILDLAAVLKIDTVALLADIVSTRAKKGLPTIVTGYWKTEVLLRQYRLFNLYYLLSDSLMQNGILRYYNLTRKDMRGKSSKVTVTEQENKNVNMSEYSGLLE